MCARRRRRKRTPSTSPNPGSATKPPAGKAAGCRSPTRQRRRVAGSMPATWRHQRHRTAKQGAARQYSGDARRSLLVLRGLLAFRSRRLSVFRCPVDLGGSIALRRRVALFRLVTARGIDAEARSFLQGRGIGIGFGGRFQRLEGAPASVISPKADQYGGAFRQDATQTAHEIAEVSRVRARTKIRETNEPRL